MAKAFDPITFDPAACRKELQAFGRLLKTADLSERDDILPFFKKHRQLAAFVGTSASNVGPAPEIACEYSFLGDFTADLVVGRRETGAYLAVEFEDGKTNSLFRKVRGRSTTDWSPRFGHGFSQLVDWFCTLDDYKKTDKFRKEFGEGYVTFAGLLVIGRDAGVSAADRVRLDWRTDKVLVDSHQIGCVTFDKLYRLLEERLGFFPEASKVRK